MRRRGGCVAALLLLSARSGCPGPGAGPSPPLVALSPQGPSDGCFAGRPGPSPGAEWPGTARYKGWCSSQRGLPRFPIRPEGSSYAPGRHDGYCKRSLIPCEKCQSPCLPNGPACSPEAEIAAGRSPAPALRLPAGRASPQRSGASATGGPRRSGRMAKIVFYTTATRILQGDSWAGTHRGRERSGASGLPGVPGAPLLARACHVRGGETRCLPCASKAQGLSGS
jgi:hypothetical protein